MRDETYKKMLKEIDDSKSELDQKVEKIKRFLENLERRHFDQNSDLVMKLFIHEVSFLKNIEYDLNKIINVY